jgi:ribonucrease Y
MNNEMMTEVVWWIPTFLTLLGIVIGYASRARLERALTDSARSKAERILKQAEYDAQIIRKEAELHERDAVIKAREEFERENSGRRKELSALEERLTKRELNIDRRHELLEEKEKAHDDGLRQIEQAKAGLRQKESQLEEAIVMEMRRIEEVANLSENDARNALLENLREDLKSDCNSLIRHEINDARARAEKEARKIITLAIERYAAEQVNDATTSTVSLPSDEMKGRIIGREGRNIRSLEAETGCNILIDETPEVVVISCFDPLRREVARIVLERLIADGRIQPARIEEMTKKVREEIDEAIREAGEEAIYELKLQGISPELVRTLGRLKFRTSYSQNVLKHSIEMGHMMGMMAAELGLDQDLAKRIGLLHDIGKAIDHTVEGGHAIIGANLLKKHGESQVVCNAVAAHHEDVEGQSVYAILASAADAISAARPGARSQSTDLYLKRLEQLESIAKQYRGVKECYAIQAGRELRVLVEPSKIDDNETLQMARNISKQIKEHVKYPGTIRVAVIRETRCVEYAT